MSAVRRPARDGKGGQSKNEEAVYRHHRPQITSCSENNEDLI